MNLIRYKSSGIYFARFRVKGKLIRRSLKTSQISVAKLRLDDLKKQERQRARYQTTVADGAMAFADALAIYQQRLAGDGSLKPRSKDYREERIAALLKSWPGLTKTDTRKISKTDCLSWAAKWAKGRAVEFQQHCTLVTIGVGYSGGSWRALRQSCTVH